MRKPKPCLMLLSCLVLAGCGADGPPQAPVQAPVQTGITVSGEARIGVVSR